MGIYSDLLFHHGHIANVALARSLAAPGKAPPASADARPEAPEATAPRTGSGQRTATVPRLHRGAPRERLSPFR
ncbi:hypothetical protein QE400_001178 [Xanthomonas sacchari]|nr:hypothetical protein [Xanthomonas sacchari]